MDSNTFNAFTSAIHGLKKKKTNYAYFYAFHFKIKFSLFHELKLDFMSLKMIKKLRKEFSIYSANF